MLSLKTCCKMAWQAPAMREHLRALGLLERKTRGELPVAEQTKNKTAKPHAPFT
jgi:hypothetical protein